MIRILTSRLKQLKKRILSGLVNSKEVYYPSEDDTDIVLSNTQQAVITANDIKSIAVYVNGLRMDDEDDYTYNSSTYTLTFDEAFEGTEKVIVTLSYIDESATDIEGNYNSSKYERVKHRTKVYDTFSSASITLDIDNFSLFVLDFRTNAPNALSINIPNVQGEAIGKILMISLVLGSTVPTITWGNNIVWSGSELSAPTIDANKTYNISFFQINNGIKYIGNLNHELNTSSLVISQS